MWGGHCHCCCHQDKGDGGRWRCHCYVVGMCSHVIIMSWERMREREGEVGEALSLLSHVREGGRSLGHWVNWNKGEEDSEGMSSSSPCHLSHCWGTLPCHHQDKEEGEGASSVVVLLLSSHVKEGEEGEDKVWARHCYHCHIIIVTCKGGRVRPWGLGGWGQGIGEALSLRCHHHCDYMWGWVRMRCGWSTIIVACGGRKGVADMQSCAMDMGMSVGQHDHIHTHTCAISIPIPVWYPLCDPSGLPVPVVYPSNWFVTSLCICTQARQPNCSQSKLARTSNHSSVATGCVQFGCWFFLPVHNQTLEHYMLGIATPLTSAIFLFWPGSGGVEVYCLVQTTAFFFMLRGFGPFGPLLWWEGSAGLLDLMAASSVALGWDASSSF